MSWAAMAGQLFKALGPEIAKAAARPQGGARGLADVFGSGWKQAQTGTGPVGGILRGYAEQKSGEMTNPLGLLGGTAPITARIPGMIGGAATGAYNAFQQDSPMKAAAEFARALPLGPISNFGAKLLESVDGVRNFGHHLHDLNTQFADVSISMASVKYQADANAFWLRQEQGERRAATASELSESRTRLNAAAAPFEDAWANLRNRVTGRFSDILSDILEKAEPIADFMEDVVDNVDSVIGAFRGICSVLDSVRTSLNRFASSAGGGGNAARAGSRIGTWLAGT